MAKATEPAKPAGGDVQVRPEPEAKTAPKASPVRTVDEWRAAKFPPVKHGVDPVWQHNAAAALHCWAQCAHHTAKPMALSEQDYDAALAAVLTTDARGVPTPHKPALYGAEKG